MIPNKSSSAAELAASLDRLGQHGSVHASFNSNKSSSAADLLELKLAQTHVALTVPAEQQVLQLR